MFESLSASNEFEQNMTVHFSLIDCLLVKTYQLTNCYHASSAGAWHYPVSAGTGWPNVSILSLGEVESLICNFCLGVTAHTVVWADESMRCASMLQEHKASNQQLHKLLAKSQKFWLAFFLDKPKTWFMIAWLTFSWKQFVSIADMWQIIITKGQPVNWSLHFIF